MNSRGIKDREEELDRQIENVRIAIILAACRKMWFRLSDHDVLIEVRRQRTDREVLRALQRAQPWWIRTWLLSVSAVRLARRQTTTLWHLFFSR